jgi:hypothetical protein
MVLLAGVGSIVGDKVHCLVVLLDCKDKGLHANGRLSELKEPVSVLSMRCLGSRGIYLQLVFSVLLFKVFTKKSKIQVSRVPSSVSSNLRGALFTRFKQFTTFKQSRSYPEVKELALR